jgi:hypothetical protein
MAYALASAVASATIISPIFHTTWFAKTTAADAVTFPDAGVIPIAFQCLTTGASGYTLSATPMAWSYCTLAVSEGIAGVTDTTIPYATAAPGAERKAAGYFIRNPRTGEIMYVEADSGYSSTSGTLTVKRGALGTTPATIVHSQYLEVMCSLHLPGPETGQVWMVYMPMGSDPGANLW